MENDLTPHDRAVAYFLELLGNWLPVEEERSRINYSQSLGVFLTEGGIDLSFVASEEGVELSLLQNIYFHDILSLHDVAKVKEELGDRRGLAYFLYLHKLMESYFSQQEVEETYGNLSPGELKKRKLGLWLSSSRKERLALCQQLLDLAWENKNSPVEWLGELLNTDDFTAA